MEAGKSFTRGTVTPRRYVNRSRGTLVDVREHRGRRRCGKLGRATFVLRGEPAWTMDTSCAQPGGIGCSLGPSGRTALLVEQRSVSPWSGQLSAVWLCNNGQ